MRSGIVTIGETMALLGTPDHCLLRAGSTPSLTIGGAESNVAIAPPGWARERPGSAGSATTISASWWCGNFAGRE